MVEPHITEDEQAEQLRRWWKKNGTSIIAGVALGIAAVLGWNWWQNHQQQLAAKASDLYESARLAAAGDDATEIARVVAQLKKDMPKSDYTSQSALAKAGFAAERGDLDASIGELKWVVENSSVDSTVQIAALRLAAAYVYTAQFELAQSLLDNTDESGFESYFAELRGDLAQARGDVDKARLHFQNAIDALLPGSGYKPALEMKLNNAVVK